MSVTRKHGLARVKVYTDAMGAAVIIPGITQFGVSLGLEVRGEPTSGDLYAYHQSVVSGAPMMRFSTHALAIALGACGTTGLAIAGATNPGVVGYAQAHSQGGSRASGSNHRKYTLAYGLLVPRTLACEQGGDATLSYEAIGRSNSGNDPIIEADSSALDSASADAERFTIHAVKLSNITLPQVKSISIDFGLAVGMEKGDDDIYPSFISINAITPVITVRGIDVEWLKSSVVTRTGLNVVHATTLITFKKRSIGGTFVAAATAEHLGITACGLATITEAFDASGQSTGECSVTIPLRYDGTNEPLTIDTTYALA